MRSVLVLRKKLVHIRVVVEGTLRSRLALHGHVLKRARGKAGLRPQVEALIGRINAEDGLDLTCAVAPLVELHESLTAYLDKLNVEIEDRARGHAVCRLLMEVPGVGPIGALSFYTAIEDPTRFRHTSDVGAYLGLVPRRYQSGEVSRTRGITKTGSKLTRTHLVTAAVIFGRHGPDCALKQWYIALRGRAGSRRASVALARKLSIVMLTMWKNEAHFEPRATAELPCAHSAV
jgi:transposase